MSDSPKWNPIPALENYQDARNQRKRGRVVTDEGKVKKVPALPYEYWCKPSGNVVRLVVMTTRNTQDGIELQRYADFTRRRALRTDWFPWEFIDCARHAPHVCAGMDKTAWEKEREKIRTARVTRHNEQSLKYQAAWRQDDEVRAAHTKEAMSEAVTEMVKVMRDEQRKGSK